MENYDDDDDTHFCNKCHETINGLDNYVSHRRTDCRSNNPSTSIVPPSYPEILNADLFFSSLKLQSSAKSLPTSRANDLLGVARATRKSVRQHEELRKIKKQRKDKSPEDKEDAKEKLANLLPVETDLDDLGLPSLVGYPDIVDSSKPASSSVISTSGKQIILEGGSSKIESYSEKHEAKDDHHRLDQDHDQHDQHHHQPVWLTDFADHHEMDIKEEIHHKHLHRYEEEYESQQEEDSVDEDSVEEDEEDSYSDSDDADADYPPRTHTGGKWKPEGHEDEVELEDTEHHHHHRHPPPSFTGGKWKPTEKYEEYEVSSGHGKELAEGHVGALATGSAEPPPSHTRGKWVPGSQAHVSTGYWCSPCGRKLASRLVYNRHLLSDLHARRSIQELDGAVQIPRAAIVPAAAASEEPQQVPQSKRQKALALKKKTQASKNEQEEDHRDDSSTKIRQRRREKKVVTCELCHVRVRRAQMGKHLLSYYHSRVASATTVQDSARAQSFLLNNMGNIVRQCPFQCAPCRFYCNTEDTFLRHWRSYSHRYSVDKICGSFVCTLCDFWCDDNESMEEHIMKQGHQDVVSMINGSMPIVIRRQSAFTCSTCCRRFRYNIQLRAHATETGHAVEYSASDEYQSRLSCTDCGQVLRTLIALQRHQLSCHRKDVINNAVADPSETLSGLMPYFCSFCSVKFETSQEAVLHRRTVSHKDMVKRRKIQDGKTDPQQWSCQHCNLNFSYLNEFRRHILRKHPELCHSCATCGKQFALSQDASRHTRVGCHAQNLGLLNPEKPYNCAGCMFSTDSSSELMFHKALHVGPVAGEFSQPRYQCGVCEKLLAKTTLRDHLRKHTGERPFPCSNCGATFGRRSTLNNHQKECIGDPRPRDFQCNECGCAFHTKSNLRQHMLTHIGKQFKCGYPGCPTILRSEAELKNHRRIVHETSFEDRKFHCNDCLYSAKTKTQLIRHCKKHQAPNTENNIPVHKCQFLNCKFQTNIRSHLTRHIRLHTGNKPYKCRHCPHACNNLENLRKHILTTKKHPGKTIYQCESCSGDEPFETNFSKELKAHLLDSHPAKYPTPTDASNYIATIFRET